MGLILGLDVSTSCTGWCILHHDGSLAEMDSIILTGHKSVYKKAQAVEEALTDVMIRYDISHVYIEENLQSFRRGFSSAQTLSTLARFNGIVSLLSYQVCGIEPVHINVNAARKVLGIKILSKKKGGAPTKEQVFNWVSGNVSNSTHTWPKKTLKSGPRKGQTILDVSSYDMADAYVICAAGIEMYNNK
tara:strand:- start:4848 stop:5414 length:567 start_codon:yes stop_codon:yes gene_type:complete